MGRFAQGTLDDPRHLINFILGYPPVREIPSEEIRHAASINFGQEDQSFFLYQNPQGYKEFRETLANFLTSKYDRDVNPDTLMAVNGCTGGIQVTLGVLSKPGDVVLVERPTYFLATAMFRQAGLVIVEVPFFEDGVDEAALERLACIHQPKFFYTVPTCHNPTGRTTSQAKREAVAALANAYNFTIIADETYQFLSFPGQQPPLPFYYFDDPNGPGRVISIGSFSKVIAPALRLGWIQANEKLLSNLLKDAFLKSGGAQAPISIGIVHRLIQSSFLNSRIEEARSSLLKRYSAMEAALARFMPDVKFEEPKGGYFVVATLPDGMDATGLCEVAKAQGVEYLPGEYFGDVGWRSCLRLSFSLYEPEEIEKGIERLAKVMKEFR